MNSLVKYFSLAFLINLPERADRLEGTAAEFGRAGWGFSPHGVELFPACKFADRGRFPGAGIRGAFQSHLQCLKRALATQARGVLILEDDIALSSALVNVTPSIVAWLDSNEWDIVYFGHYGTGPVPDATSKTTAEEFRFQTCDKDVHGLHFYGVNGRILERLVAHLERVANGIEGDQAYGPMPVDGALNVFRHLNSDVRAFTAHPKLGWQRPSRSDISPGKLDRIGVLKPLASMVRRIKNTTRA